ncbi:hypothetical protein Scep_030444 [Stephania cephalantha]|uniref:Uncharacterized protein n=1 Tax=Stephania cephalantha TaxID=152367 RepID=A0AAP0E2V0_9MAGN
MKEALKDSQDSDGKDSRLQTTHLSTMQDILGRALVMPGAMTKVVTQPPGTTLTWSIHASGDLVHVSLRDRDCLVVSGCA